jgi:hypothetical protein
VNTTPRLIGAAKVPRRFVFRFEFYLDLLSKLLRRAIALLPPLFALVTTIMLAATCNVLTAMAQSQTSAKPAPTPAAQPTAPGQKPESAAPTTTGTIKGRLVSDDGQPLTNANVMVQSLTATPAVKPTRVDAEGRFVFDELPAASYIVIATAPGYIDQSTSLEPSQWPRYLIGAQVKITMIKGGVITGLVTNAKGEPMVGIPVHTTMTNGPLSSIMSFLNGGGISESDDRGIYRIYGLLPGQYIVNAGGSGQFGQFTASGFDIDVPTYYPSSTRDTAVPVSVRSGDETSGIDIRYKGTEGHSISGVVLGNIEATATSGAVTIMLSHAGTSSVLSLELAGVADPRRAFSFNGVADGEYDLSASYLASQTENALVGTKRVTVSGSDVTGVELRLASLASIAGTITLDPLKPEDKCDKRGSQVIEILMNAPRDDPKKGGNQALTSIFGGFGGMLNAGGEFNQRNLEAGRYRPEIKLPTEGWYVRAINMPSAAAQRAPQESQRMQAAQPLAANPNQSNAWQGVVNIRSGEHLSGASIMVGQDAAGLRGRVAAPGEGSAIPAGIRAHLVPADREQANNVLRYSETLVNSDGSFAFTNLAPGRYFILSRVEAPTETDAPPRPSALDPLVRAKLRREAEAANTVVDLKPCQRMVDYALKLTASQ